MRENLMLEIMDGKSTVNVKTALAKAEKLRQIISGFVYSLKEGTSEKICNPLASSSPKLDALLDIIEETTFGIIVWCEYDYDAQCIAALLTKNNITHTSILAGAKLEEIEAAKKAVGNTVRVLITKPRVMGYGHTINNAPVSIYFSRYYWGEPFAQSKMRNLRIGQHSKVLYYHLIYTQTIDVAIQKVLDNKLELEKQIAPDGVKELL